MGSVEGEEACGEERRELSAAQRARMERQRLRARTLRDSRPQQRNTEKVAPAPAVGAGCGGFLPEEWQEPSPAEARPSPLVHPGEQPHCLRCDHLFPQSYLYDNFDHPVCDECRKEDGEDGLITRTEAKNQYLLKDCDLDKRPPALRCVRRRNPHSARYGDMRLYVRAQVAARALVVWGDEAALEEERGRREGARATGAERRAHRRLRALRMDVRSTLYTHERATHRHDFAPETHDPISDTYSRSCLSCDYSESYEKM